MERYPNSRLTFRKEKRRYTAILKIAKEFISNIAKHTLLYQCPKFGNLNPEAEILMKFCPNLPDYQ